jgi:hypothetical protein
MTAALLGLLGRDQEDIWRCAGHEILITMGIYRRVGRGGERTAQREFNMNLSYACINFARESKR